MKEKSSLFEIIDRASKQLFPKHYRPHSPNSFSFFYYEALAKKVNAILAEEEQLDNNTIELKQG